VYVFGKRKYDEADYAAALNAFNEAYKTDCTKHDLLVIIGKTYEAMGNRPEAVRAYETYLERVPNASDAETYKRRIANLKAQMPSQPSGGATPTTTPPPQPTAAAAATTTTPPTGQTAAAATNREPERGHTVPPWIITAGGGALAVTGGILYLVGAGDISSAEKVCGTNHNACPKGAPAIDQGNTGKSLELVGGTLFIGGVLLAGGGLLWHFLEPTGPKQERARVTPLVAPGVAGVGVSGSFE
jgi:tetratricopeptide (TPR) repeat protein